MADRKVHIEPGESTPLYPWYKERLRTKFLKDSVKRQHLSGALDGRRRGFLDTGVDSFTDGYLVSGAETCIQPPRGPAPVIFGLSGQACPGKLPKRFTKEQVCFSKQNRLSQERRQYVEAVERKLKTHPLALYPYLECGMTPELFDDVLSVLDPELHVKREPTDSSSEIQEHTVVNEGPCEGHTHSDEPSTDVTTKPSISMAKEVVKGISSGNAYKGEDVKENHIKEKQLASVKGLRSPSQDEELKKVTKLFCDWITSLGGETNNFTESSILSLFVSGYEKKPASTFPIQVLEPSQIPKELRTTGECLRKHSSCRALAKHSTLNKRQLCAPRVKTTYGAWYLDPKTWKKRSADEPLRDHSVSKDLDLAEQPTEKDEELKQIHGTQAFKQFIVSKGLRMPRFLSSLFLEEDQESSTTETDRIGSAPTRKGTVVL